MNLPEQSSTCPITRRVRYGLRLTDRLGGTDLVVSG
jgi:hypothetical protein